MKRIASLLLLLALTLGAAAQDIKVTIIDGIQNQALKGRMERGIAQLLSEVRAGERYWFTDEETHSLQRANAPYQSTLDLDRIVLDCFRKPAADEPCAPLSMSAIVEVVQRQYSFVQPTHSTKIQLGFSLASQGFECHRGAFGVTYLAVPKAEN